MRIKELIDFNYDKKQLNLKKDKIIVYLFSDIFCSNSWQLEPQIQRFRYEYSQYIDFRLCLINNFNNFKNLAFINDLKKHFINISNIYRMPINDEILNTISDIDINILYKIFSILERIDKNLSYDYLRELQERFYILNDDILNIYIIKKILSNLILRYKLNISVDDILNFIDLPVVNNWIEENNLLKKMYKIDILPTVVIISSDKNVISIKGNREYENYDYVIKELTNREFFINEINNINIKDFIFSKNIISSVEIEEFLGFNNKESYLFMNEFVSKYCDDYKLKKVRDEFILIKTYFD